jgi:acetyl-CoA carboxylase biotin carboxyl carrier protein
MAIIEVKTEVAGIVWKIVAGAGDAVSEDDTVIILESMKMEISARERHHSANPGG